MIVAETNKQKIYPIKRLKDEVGKSGHGECERKGRDRQGFSNIGVYSDYLQTTLTANSESDT